MVFENKLEHPSYAVARFTRCSSSAKTRLFGSNVVDHHATILLEICPATMANELGQDWVFGSLESYVTVEMSAAQFVEMLTTMNVGSGTPCTLRRFNGKNVEPPPSTGTEAERVHDYFRDRMENIGQKLREISKATRKILDGRPNKTTKTELEKSIAMLIQEVEKNMPFVQEQFQRAVDKTTTQAKAELDSLTSLTLMRLGLQKLDELKAIGAEGSQALLEAEGSGEVGSGAPLCFLCNDAGRVLRAGSWFPCYQCRAGGVEP